MDTFECYTFDGAINKKIVFTRSQYQGYAKLLINIWRQGKLIFKDKQEPKRGLSQTDQISKPP